MLPKITNDGVSFHLSDVSFSNACAPLSVRLNVIQIFIQISVSTSKRNEIIENAKNQNAHINSMILNSQDKNIHDKYEGYYILDITKILERLALVLRKFSVKLQ